MALAGIALGGAPRFLKVLAATAVIFALGFVASPGTSPTAHAGVACYTLTMNVGSGSGSIVNMPSSTGGCPTNQYSPGYLVAIVAIPASGYVFTSWSGTDNNSTSATTVTMNGDQKVTANFEWNCHTLTMNVGAGSGSIVNMPSSAGGCPTNQYSQGYSVAIGAIPASGYVFTSWLGTDNNSASATTVTMNGDQKVTANFGWNCYTLTTNVGAGAAPSSTCRPAQEAARPTSTRRATQWRL